MMKDDGSPIGERIGDVSLQIARQIVGREKFEALLDALGGSAVYFPKPNRGRRNEAVRREFAALRAAGYSVSESVRALAQRFGVTSRWIRIIVYGKKNRRE